MLEIGFDRTAYEFFLAQNHTAKAAALAVDVLCGRVDNKVSAQLACDRVDRRRHGVVDNDQRVVCVGQIDNGLHVDDFEGGVRNGLEEHDLGVRTDCGFPCVHVTTIDEGDLNAEAGQHFFEDIEARTEQRAARYNVVARFQQRHQRTVDGSHTGGGRETSFNAFEVGHAVFEHRNGRVAIAGIDELVVAQLDEALLCLLGSVVNEALGEEDGFAQFVVFAAADTAVNCACALGKFVHVLSFRP